MIRLFPILALMVLSACASQQERCIKDATRNIEVLDELIAETRLNISRGFAVQKESVPTTNFRYCVGNSSSNVGVSFCSGTSTSTREIPVAIDMAQEQAKLDGLLKSREEALARLQSTIEMCQLRYPNG